MKLLSNNLRGKIEFPKGAVVRVNSAWVSSEKELEKILRENADSQVFLDFPSGRTKPPKPVLTLTQLIHAANTHENIKYFAVSNAEDGDYLHVIRNLLEKRVSLVPKIETLQGVRNIDIIARWSKCRVVMLDREDLYLDCKADTKKYENSMGILKDKCSELGIKVIELKGVYFE